MPTVIDRNALRALTDVALAAYESEHRKHSDALQRLTAGHQRAADAARKEQTRRRRERGAPAPRITGRTGHGSRA